MKIWLLIAFALSIVSCGAFASSDSPSKERQSSYEFMTLENKAMQDDPNLNPAMFWVKECVRVHIKPVKSESQPMGGPPGAERAGLGELEQGHRVADHHLPPSTRGEGRGAGVLDGVYYSIPIRTAIQH